MEHLQLFPQRFNLGIEDVPLGLEAAEVVRPLADLELQVVDARLVVRPQPVAAEGAPLRPVAVCPRVASYPVSFEVAGGPNELVAFIRPISPSTSESIGCWLVVVVGVPFLSS